MRRRVVDQVAGILVASVLSISALADVGVPPLMMQCWTEGSEPVIWWPAGVPNGDGTFSYVGSYQDPDGHWTLDYDVLVKPDPFINAAYALTNPSNSTQVYNLLTTLPVAPPIVPSSLMGGSTGGSLTDANFDGSATVSTIGPGTSFYAGQIDGVSVLPLYSDPNSWSVWFPGQTVNIPQISAGLPGPTLPGPAVLTSIGILHQFSLTPGDAVSLTSFFVAVPEPASLALLAIGTLVLRRR
jgi:hypothetical protein